jgi:rubredoxin
MFKCTVCGYIHDGTEAPEACPKCGAPAKKFDAVEGDARTLIEKSRYTNDLHMHLLTLLQEVEAISADGAAENLDPGCVAIFEKAKDTAVILVQSIKAELAGHASKSKWG